MNIQIRKAEQQDLAAVFSLIREFSIFQQTPEKVHITLEQMQEDKDLFQCFVAETDAGEVIGFASFFFAYYSWSGKALYLDDLYVKESFRGGGTGTRLLEAVIAYARQERCKKMRWQVSRWNANAIGFYKKMGAVVDDVEMNCDLVF